MRTIFYGAVMAGVAYFSYNALLFVSKLFYIGVALFAGVILLGMAFGPKDEV